MDGAYLENKRVFLDILSIPKAIIAKNPREGRYSQCSATTAFKGNIILAIAKRLIKNQSEKKKIIFERLKLFIIPMTMNINSDTERKRRKSIDLLIGKNLSTRKSKGETSKYR